MKYYIISHSSDPSIIGVRNGMYQVKFDKYCFDSIESYEKFNNFFYELNYYQKPEKFLNVNIVINKLYLYHGAKLTDVMGIFPDIPYVNFLISENLKNILVQFQIQKNLLFETTVINRKRNLNYLYYFFYLPNLPFETIILEKSELYSRKLHLEGTQLKAEDTIHKIKNRDHYEQLKYSFLTSDFSKICISSIYENLDLIHVGGYIFISEKLKNAIRLEDITGLEIGNRCELVFN